MTATFPPPLWPLANVDVEQLEPPAAVAVPPLGARLQLVRAVLVVVFVLSLTMLLQLVLFSPLQQRAAQQRAMDHFRSELARGTAPIGPTDGDRRELRPGTPVAYLEIPAIGLQQVVGEGTAASSLFDGPGHRRDSPLPGQVGVSVLLGRSAAFGGPFARLDELEVGDPIRATTGQGTFSFRVVAVRREGDPLPEPLGSDAGRVLLATADGAPFLPSGVLRVDADLVGEPVVGPPHAYNAETLPAQERLMASDARTLWALALWLQALTGVALVAVWAYHRWGMVRTWVVFLPPLLLVGLATSGQVARLLPNLL